MTFSNKSLENREEENPSINLKFVQEISGLCKNVSKIGISQKIRFETIYGI